MGLCNLILTGEWNRHCKKCGEEIDDDATDRLCNTCRYSGSDNQIIHRNSKYGQ